MTSLEALPETFLARLEQIIPEDQSADVLASFSQPRAVSFRLNSLKADAESVLAELACLGLEPQAVSWLPNAYTLAPELKSRLTQSPPHLDGRIYVQNLSSMLPVIVLQPQPGERVLDLAAAPGSKTLQLACVMKNHGWISAVEKVKSRYYRLKANIRLHDADCVHTYLMDGGHVWKKCPEQFDRVLIDAPCSSEARFRGDAPDSFAYWSERKIKEMSRKQGRLLFSAVQSLKPGGVLVYSTCSFAPEENERAISKLIKTFGDALSIEAIELPLANRQPGLNQWQGRSFADGVERSVRVLPNEQMEGFFLCKLRKHRSTLK